MSKVTLGFDRFITELCLRLWPGDPVVVGAMLNVRARSGQGFRRAEASLGRLENTQLIPATQYLPLESWELFEKAEPGEIILKFVVIAEGSAPREVATPFPTPEGPPRWRTRLACLDVEDLFAAVDSSVLVIKERAIWPFWQQETSRYLNSHAAGSDARSLFHDGLARTIFPTVDFQGDDVPYVLLGARSWEWGHWMLDFLARVAAVQPPPGATILVDSRLGESHLWWLRQLVPGVRVCGYELGAQLRLARAHVMLPRTFCPPTWPHVYGKPTSFFNQLPEDTLALRAALRRPRQRAVSRQADGSRRIWLRRKGSLRTLIGEDDLGRLLYENGFIDIFAEDWHPKDLAPILEGAEWIIGVEGSSFLNLLLSNSTSKVALITTATDVPLNHLEQLQVLGHQPYLVLGRELQVPGRPPGHSDIELAPATLMQLGELLR